MGLSVPFIISFEYISQIYIKNLGICVLLYFSRKKSLLNRVNNFKIGFQLYTIWRVVKELFIFEKKETMLDINSNWIILIVVLAAFGWMFMLLKQFMAKEEKVKILELKKDTNKTTIPIRLQAYERIALLLERIHPRSVILRVAPSKTMDVKTYMFLLQQNVQQEYEHNLSQQIYISPKLWETVNAAKNQMVLEINATARTLNPADSSFALFDALQRKMDEDSEDFVAWISDVALLNLQREVATQF